MKRRSIKLYTCLIWSLTIWCLRNVKSLIHLKMAHLNQQGFYHFCSIRHNLYELQLHLSFTIIARLSKALHGLVNHRFGVQIRRIILLKVNEIYLKKPAKHLHQKGIYCLPFVYSYLLHVIFSFIITLFHFDLRDLIQI